MQLIGDMLVYSRLSLIYRISAHELISTSPKKKKKKAQAGNDSSKLSQRLRLRGKSRQQGNAESTSTVQFPIGQSRCF